MKTPEKALFDWANKETYFGGDRWVYPLNLFHVIDLLHSLNNGYRGEIMNYPNDGRDMKITNMFGEAILSTLLRNWEKRPPITPQLFFQFEDMYDLGKHLGVDVKALQEELKTPTRNTYPPKRMAK